MVFQRELKGKSLYACALVTANSTLQKMPPVNIMSFRDNMNAKFLEELF